MQECKRKRFLSYVLYIYCLMVGEGQQRTSVSLVETVVFYDSAAKHPLLERGFTLRNFRLLPRSSLPLLGYYAVSSGNFLPTFRDNLTLRIGPTGCPETSEINYHNLLRNNPEEGSSELHAV